MASFARSAELLKYTWPGWAAANVEGLFLDWVNRLMLPAMNSEALQRLPLANWHTTIAGGVGSGIPPHKQHCTTELLGGPCGNKAVVSQHVLACIVGLPMLTRARFQTQSNWLVATGWLAYLLKPTSNKTVLATGILSAAWL